MNRTTFRNTVLGIGATAAAIAFGYFGVQQLGRNNMFTIAAAVGGNTCRLRGKGEGEKGKKKPLTFTL
jgi:uncharacterized membrane protein YeaQ/YmgE (transglycosylase-associated protein family)